MERFSNRSMDRRGFLRLAGSAILIAGAAPFLTSSISAEDSEVGETHDNVTPPTNWWNSNVTPPPHIRILLTTGPHSGEVVHPTFRIYCKCVLPKEWIPSWPSASLYAGALAVKSYAWYWTLYSKHPGTNYDLRDDASDQVYDPASRQASTDAAVDGTWNYRLTTASRGKIIESSYCLSGQCNDHRGTYMTQNGSRDLANRRWTWRQILHRYYSNMSIRGIRQA